MLTTNDHDTTTLQSDRDDDLGGARLLDRALKCHLTHSPHDNYFDELRVRVFTESGALNAGRVDGSTINYYE